EKVGFENVRAQVRALQAQQQEEFDKERFSLLEERNELMIDQAKVQNQLKLALNREASVDTQF
ncbi:hypothetical protein HAX54_023732, partial [Datura stramonium]|nr:hypothetical protein [Datura stramonium]